MTAIAFVASAWGPRFGGINAFNADLCTAVAQARPDVTVYCVTPGATDKEIDQAHSAGVELVSLADDPTDRPLGTTFGYALADWSREDRDVEWWIGHDVITGPAAVVAAQRTHTRSAIIQHTDYSSYGSLKGTGGPAVLQRDQAEAETLSQADVLFGVGPKLAAAAIDRVRAANRASQVTQLVPGLPVLEPSPVAPNTFRAITFGRLDEASDRIKQGRLAVRSFGELIGQVPDMVGSDPRITVVGLSVDRLAAEEDKLAGLAEDGAHRAVTVIGHPFIEEREVLFRALVNSSVSMMLSLHEGFGLTGWEAIAAEVPLILSKNSGLYDLLASVGGQALGCVHTVDVRGQRQPPYYSDNDIREVTNALRDIARSPHDAKRDARALKKVMAAHDWASAAHTFLDGLGLQPDPLADYGSKQTRDLPDVLPPAVLPPIIGHKLVGRSTELSDLGTLMRSGERLVTVLGAPGCGKTRLVIEVAHAVREAFADKVYFVDLTNVTKPDLVAASITQALRLKPHDPVLDALKQLFRERKTLLVLDNFEQVISAALPLRELIAGAPGLQVLVTSREPLKVASEVEFPLDELSPEAAIALFRECQGRVAETEDVGGVRDLCAKVDNLPLAIELIAAHAHVYSSSELLELIRDSALDLNSTRRDATTKQRSLRQAIDWSHGLLTATEARTFRRLAVFAGGWTLTSASGVLTGSDRVDRELALTMTSLYDKSFIRRGEDGRLSMLDTLRTYAGDKLREEPEEADRTYQSHANYFLGRFEAAVDDPAARLESPRLRELSLESENCDSALNWLLAVGRTHDAIRMAAYLGRLWWSNDLLRGFARLGECLARIDTAEASRDQAVAALWHGRLGLRLGRLEAAKKSFANAIATAGRVEDEFLVVTAKADAALVDIEKGNFTAARALVDEAERWFAVTPGLGYADVLDTLGIIHACDGDYESAAVDFARSIALYTTVGDEIGVAWVQVDQSALALAQEGLAEATDLADSVWQVGTEHGELVLQCWADHYRGLARCGLGPAAVDAAKESVTRCAATARVLGDQRLTALSLEGYAALRATEGKSTKAISLAEAAAQLRDRTGIPISPLERRLLGRYLDLAIAEVDHATAEIARNYGRSLTLDRAMALAESG